MPMERWRATVITRGTATTRPHTIAYHKCRKMGCDHGGHRRRHYRLLFQSRIELDFRRKATASGRARDVVGCSQHLVCPHNEFSSGTNYVHARQRRSSTHRLQLLDRSKRGYDGRHGSRSIDECHRFDRHQHCPASARSPAHFRKAAAIRCSPFCMKKDTL